ncbi:hypothetical protein CYLTODRAFT_486781 [Cylindrobasidium torrendii FP15055 ss-10]|uniref:Uncharacterized protein n=1 Tax=Cylindrobasidium torrendii FP15055 ss-10 TaxID=1314674 RepID=A0A0D7BN67_9AGAR|nr:hypothetical protein CYLTODRAFT_486781 [Cylindrobasidium torrendii FP15055 ss-10]
MSSSPARTSSPYDFLSAELAASLSEQHFGLKSWTMKASSTKNMACASVVLLDGRAMEMSLTNRGYTQIDGSETYETLESLLSTLSNLYHEKRMELLFAKLEQVSARDHEELSQEPIP